MVILALSVDFELIRVLSALLRGDGCSVAGCAGVEQARELPEPFELVAMVVDGGAVPEALTLVHELRASGSLKPAAPVIFLADDKQRAGDIAAVGAHLLLNPPSLLDLVDTIRAALPARVAPPAPRAQEPAPRAGPTPRLARSGEAMANARRLARWWASRATGVLSVEGRGDGWALLSQGGPVGPDGVEAVEQALQGGEVTLDSCEVDEPGDRALMARLLWRAARDAAGGESVVSFIPTSNGLTRAAGGLPLSPEIRRCLERLGGVTVARLAERERAAVAEVSTDLAALRWLGMLSLRDPQPTAIEVEVDSPTGGGPTFAAETPTSPGTPDPTAVVDGLLRDGLAAAGRSAWAQADALFSRARARAPENAVVAAHLGWTRAHNPELPIDARASQGADLVELALQIDADCGLAWRYCGQLASLRGDVDEAARCFEAARKLRS